MEKNTNKQAKDNTVKQRLQDILLSVSWREVANTYFDRSASWLYHKLDGIDGNGGVGGFTDKEKEQLRGALVDLSDRIRRAAANISAGDCITPLRHKSSAPTDAHQPRDFTVSRRFCFWQLPCSRFAQPPTSDKTKSFTWLQISLHIPL